MQAASAQVYQPTYLPFREGHDLLLSTCTDFAPRGYFVCQRGAQRHSAGVVGIVVVVRAAGVDVVEVVVVVVRAAQPPPGERNGTFSDRNL